MDFVRTLKALADPLRFRVLAAVAEEELTVGEVQEVVESVQSSVSRNLAILRDAGFVQDRKEGTNVYFSVAPGYAGSRRASFSSRCRHGWRRFPEVKRDRDALGGVPAPSLASLDRVISNRWPETGSVFARSYFDDRVTSLAIEKLLPRNLTVADIGCGTGSLTFELARFARKVIGVDLSNEMLRRARAVAKERRDPQRRVPPGRRSQTAVGSRQRRRGVLCHGAAFSPDPAACHRRTLPYHSSAAVR